LSLIFKRDNLDAVVVSFNPSSVLQQFGE